MCCTTDARTLDDPMAEGKDEIPTDTEFLVRSPEVTAIVRKELAVAIRDLMHHGLGQVRGAVPCVFLMHVFAAKRGEQPGTVLRVHVSPWKQVADWHTACLGRGGQVLRDERRSRV